MGTHGKGPVWQSVVKNDNSKVTGILPGGKPKGRADSPSAGAIPWLLIEAKGEGSGMFSKVTRIPALGHQRRQGPGGLLRRERVLHGGARGVHGDVLFLHGEIAKPTKVVG